jgi:hypothetical protein
MKSTESTLRVPQNVTTSSRSADLCKPLVLGSLTTRALLEGRASQIIIATTWDALILQQGRHALDTTKCVKPLSD